MKRLFVLSLLCAGLAIMANPALAHHSVSGDYFMDQRATVEGEIFSKSLAVEENVQFEGVSRKLEKPIDSSAIARTPTVKPVAGATTTGPAAAAAA